MHSIDLKHMRVFLRLVRERSASRVAAEMGMSQQAISGYLKRLREALPHEIFVRHSSGIEPTDFALDIARKFERILSDVDDVVFEDFDPATLERNVGIIANEYAQLSVLPRFVAEIRARAPRVSVKVMDFYRETHAEQLERGDADIAVGFGKFFDDSLARHSLAEETYCCVVGERSRIVGELRHVADVAKFPRVDFADSASYSQDAISAFLATHDALVPPVATLACYTSLKPFLEFNDVVAFVPSAIADGLRLTRLDLDSMPEMFTTAVGWHRKRAGNPLGIWLREVLMETLEKQRADEENCR
ncbi:NodD transcription activator-like protein [Pandoraea aquatica]|uniref:NodD transcription activator-like protein n=1 Tax=Pandoraea aquatica TaxID=2508290 RepID=A0A5E4Y916_9BURK|nr:LysR family transcriptional regulator [Pandoraea aquatica]VVE45176.1 NodD transcription activator-like protein [Pandoraea aquatica]